MQRSVWGPKSVYDNNSLFIKCVCVCVCITAVDMRMLFEREGKV